MNVLSGLLGPDPGQYIGEHVEVVRQCADDLHKAIGFWLEGDYDQLKLTAKQIMKIENDADRIRERSTRAYRSFYFLGFSRENFNSLMFAQDGIANAVEDLMFILTVRRTQVPEPLQEPLKALYTQVHAILDLTLELNDNFRLCQESGYGGPIVEEMLQQIKRIGKLEWETDKRLYKFAQALYEHEDSIDPVSIMMLAEITKKLSEIANAAEQVALATGAIVER